MGIDTITTFHPGVRLDDVADLASHLVGHESRLVSFKGAPGAYFDADGHTIKTYSSVPTMVTILVKKTPLTQRPMDLTYHFEADSGAPGSTALRLPHSPLGGVLAHRLAEAFGGLVDLNDCDDVAADIVCTGLLPFTSDGAVWDLRQRQMADAPRITPADVEAFAERYAERY